MLSYFSFSMLSSVLSFPLDSALDNCVHKAVMSQQMSNPLVNIVIMNCFLRFLLFLRSAGLQQLPPDPHFKRFCLLSMFFVMVHVSDPYIAVLHTVALTILSCYAQYSCNLKTPVGEVEKY